MSETTIAEEFSNLLTDGGRASVGEQWRRMTGEDLPDDLAGFVDLGREEVFEAIRAHGGDAIAAGSFVASALSALGASSAAGPIGWAVAGAVALGQLAASVRETRLAMARAHNMGRRHLDEVVACLRLLGVEFETRGGAEIANGSPPNFRDRPMAAFWFIRIAELTAVMSGKYGKSGIAGTYRSGLYADLVMQQDRVFRRLREGRPYIPMYANVPSASGAIDSRIAWFTRGVRHINTVGLSEWARGGAQKAQRTMAANLVAAQALRSALARQPEARRQGFLAAMMEAAWSVHPEMHWSRGQLGTTVPIRLLARAYAEAPVVGSFRLHVDVPRGMPLSVGAMLKASPYTIEMERRPIAFPRASRVSFNVNTNNITPTVLLLGRPNGPDPGVIVAGQFTARAGQVVEVPAGEIRRVFEQAQPVPGPYRIAAPPDAAGLAQWAQDTGLQWFDRFPYREGAAPAFIRRQVLNRSTGDGIGLAGIAAALGALYLATRG